MQVTEAIDKDESAMPAVSRRVLILGGTSRSLINFRGPLLQRLRQRGHWVLAAAGADAAIDDVRTSLEAMGITYTSLALARGGVNPWEDWHSARQIRDLLMAFRPDVLIAYTAKPVIYGGLAVGRIGGIRFFPMITGLGYAFADTGGLRRSLVHLAQRQLYRRALMHATTTIFQNPDDQRLFARLGLVTQGTVRVHGSGVDLLRFPPAPLPPKPVFLMLARLVADKGVREYAAAARQLRPRFPLARFQLAGALETGPRAISRDELAAWQNEGIIDYLGRVSDVPAALAGCRCYVLPSFYREGIPRSVLEAMATGRPIITTDAPGCRETVEDGKNGYLVAPRSAAALATAMTRILEADPAKLEAMAARSLARARELYDVDKVDRDILQITGL
ncbi:glycosyltransferase family 4 protein [Billgrantia lactosivorans]|uniref:glycosyltransferase family 4 protein n=1 Tax=Billgrantia lactosivorans TaxID=2185141 RepID=UPI001C553A92|nr:glycosyltransferase family 4 protein [Halomonas lactosivorans]